MTHRPFKLGMLKAKPEQLRKTLKLAHYLDLSQMTEFVPPEFDLFQGVPDYVDMNDQLGDCVVASMAKMVRSWTQNATGTAATVTNADILDVYQKGAGYDSNDPSTDQGWYLLEALKYWQKYGIAGHKIGAYVAINPKHHAMVRAASYLFGGLYVGATLPNAIWSQDVWDVGGDASIAGGHCMTSQTVLTDRPSFRTWGYPQPCTWAWWDKWVDECYAIVSTDSLKNGVNFAGIDLATLNADLQIVTA